MHSPINAEKSTVSDLDTASPGQTIIDKDKSNPFMIVTFSKSEDEESSRRTLPKTLTQGEALKRKKIISKKKKKKKIEVIIQQTLESFFKNKEHDKYMISNLSPSPERGNPSP